MKSYAQTIAFTAILLFSSVCFAGSEELYDSVVRIRAEYGAGTGWVYKIQDDIIYIMTAGHVLSSPVLDEEGEHVGFEQNKEEPVVDLFYGRKEKLGIPAKIVKWVYEENTAIDVGVVAVKVEDLGTYPSPKPLKLVTNKHKPLNGHVVFTIGCPMPNDPRSPESPSVLRTYIFNIEEDVIWINSYVISGRSGSPLVDSHNRVIGMVIWRPGGCTSYTTIKEIFDANENVRRVRQ